MPLISSSIPNLINGVSQQPPALRLASQAEQVINCMPSPVEGLKKRPPFYHLKKLHGLDAAATYAQTGTTLAITTASAHGLTTGDMAKIHITTGLASTRDKISGTYPVTVVSSTTFTVTVKHDKDFFLYSIIGYYSLCKYSRKY